LLLVTGLICVVVLLVVTCGPFTIAVAAAWALTAYCARYIRQVRRARAGKDDQEGAGLRYNLCATGVLYLVPICVAATGYLLLTGVVRMVAGQAGIGWLISVQHLFEATSDFVERYLNLSELAVFGIMVGVYVLTCVLLARKRGPLPEQERRGLRFRVISWLNTGVEWYAKYANPVSAGVATLAALTVFGMQVGAPASNLELRIKIAQRGYSDLSRQVDADLSQQVATGLFHKIQQQLPKPYRDALALPNQLLDAASDVQTRASDAAVDGVTIPAVDKAVDAVMAQRAKVDAVPSEIVVHGPAPDDPPPPDVTLQQVDAAEKSITAESAAERPKDTRVDLVAEGQKKVTLQVEKLASEQILALTKPLTSAVPILEPMISAFADSMDETLQQRLGVAYDRIMAKVLRDPQHAGKTVRAEAESIVSHTNVSPDVARALPSAKELSVAMTVALASMRHYPTLIDQRVSKALAEQTPDDPDGLPDLLPLPDDLPPINSFDLNPPNYYYYEPPPEAFTPPPEEFMPPPEVYDPPPEFFGGE
jgi:hypothetical protein